MSTVDVEDVLAHAREHGTGALDGDPGLRQQARASLKQRGYRVPPAERPTFETAMWMELEETAHLLTALADVEGLARKSAPETVFHLISALREEVDQAQQRVLGLLALLHPPALVAQVRAGLAGPDDQHAIALEVLEGLAPPRMRPMLTAALEAAPPTEKLARLNTHFPQPRLALPARLAEMLCEPPSNAASALSGLRTASNTAMRSLAGE